MKHKKLHSVAHNFADSLASGFGMAVGYYLPTDVFADAAVNDDGSVTVDFLLGEVHGRTTDHVLRGAIPLYRKAFLSFA